MRLFESCQETIHSSGHNGVVDDPTKKRSSSSVASAGAKQAGQKAAEPERVDPLRFKPEHTTLPTKFIGSGSEGSWSQVQQQKTFSYSE